MINKFQLDFHRHWRPNLQTHRHTVDNSNVQASFQDTESINFDFIVGLWAVDLYLLQKCYKMHDRLLRFDVLAEIFYYCRKHWMESCTIINEFWPVFTFLYAADSLEHLKCFKWPLKYFSRPPPGRKNQCFRGKYPLMGEFWSKKRYLASGEPLLSSSQTSPII